MIPDYDEGDTHWDGTTLTVAPGELEQFTLTGIGTDCALDGQAWTEGRVTVNGEPYDVERRGRLVRLTPTGETTE